MEDDQNVVTPSKEHSALMAVVPEELVSRSKSVYQGLLSPQTEHVPGGETDEPS